MLHPTMELGCSIPPWSHHRTIVQFSRLIGHRKVEWRRLPVTGSIVRPVTLVMVIIVDKMDMVVIVIIVDMMDMVVTVILVDMINLAWIISSL